MVGKLHREFWRRISTISQEGHLYELPECRDERNGARVPALEAAISKLEAQAQNARVHLADGLAVLQHPLDAQSLHPHTSADAELRWKPLPCFCQH